MDKNILNTRCPVAFRTSFATLVVVLWSVLWCLLCAPALSQTDVPKPTPEVQTLIRAGEAAGKSYHWEEALRSYNAALEQARERQDRAGEGAALHRIGNAYLNMGQLRKALEVYPQAQAIYHAIGERRGEAATLTNQGIAHLSAGEHEKALELFQQTLTLRKALMDRRGEADALQNIGTAYAGADQLQRALEYYRQALPIHREVGNREGEANTLNSIGLASIYQPQQALEYFQQALTLRKAIGDKRGQANTLTSIGLLHTNAGQPQKALECYQQALTLRQATGDTVGEAAALSNIGFAYALMERPQKALEYYQQALPILHKAGNRPFEANTLGHMGIAYSDIGLSQKALECYQQTLALHKALGNREGEAAILTDIGIIYADTGEPQRALEYYQQALPIHRTMGNRLNEANTLCSIGHVYLETDQPTFALEHYQQALPIYRELGNRQLEADTLNSLGLSYQSMAQMQKALEYYRQALPLHRLVGDRVGEGATLINTGLIYEDMGQSQRALKCFRQALPIQRAVGNREDEAKALHGTGLAYANLGQPKRALEYCWQALSLYQITGDRSGEAGVLHLSAREEQKLHRLADAEAHLAQAVALLETYRANLGGYTEAKTAFLSSHLDTYYAYLDLLLKRHKTAAAFALAQKTKARSLLDLLYDGKVALNAALNSDESREEQELQQQADFLNAQMLHESVLNLPGAKQRFATLGVQLRAVEGHLQTFTDTLYARHPDLAVKRVAATASLPEIAPFLPEDTALLEYLQVSNRKLALLVVTQRQKKAELAVYSLPVKAQALAAECADFHASCADPHRDYRALARSLYLLLVQPAARELAGKRRLIVCPDGPLWDVPFQALLASHSPTRAQESRESEERFLADRFEIAYAYSATGALAAWEMHARRRQPPSGSLLAFANPDFGSPDRFGSLKAAPEQRPFDRPSRPFDRPSRPFDRPSRPFDRPSRAVEGPADLMTTLVSAGGIAPLPGTQREVEALQGVFPDAAVYTGSQAQAETARQQAGRYRYLHFATHGFFNDADPLLSAIVLAQPPPGSTDTGFLTARDLFGWTLNADLVTLSACNTARGGLQSGEGVIGMTWALFVAGAPSQVVAQWSVDDESTAALMQQFYGNLKSGQAKGRALQAAASSLRQEKQRRHPYYWAPFILMGDWH